MPKTLLHEITQSAQVPGIQLEAVRMLAETSVAHGLNEVDSISKTFEALSDPNILTKPLERQISGAERKLGIRTPGDRTLEAMLFVDAPILDYALIIDANVKPERLFGRKAWADHLDARLYMREAAASPLSPELIMNAQQLLTRRSAPESAGVIRDIGLAGGKLDTPLEPDEYSAAQIAAIEAHPQLSFRSEPEDDPSSMTGYIYYPYLEDGKKTVKAIQTELKAICKWYNQTKASDSHDPYALAAELQQRLVTLHPFMDGNGRVSRLLMNWSLMADGQPPSFLSDPNADVTTQLAPWSEEVRLGSRQYARAETKRNALADAGIEDAAAIVGVGEPKAFYQYVYRHIQPAAELSSRTPINHSYIRSFGKAFTHELERFLDYTNKYRSIQDEKTQLVDSIQQGGLLTTEYIKFATSPDASVVPSELSKQLLSEISVYRGGGVHATRLKDEDILAAFQGYTSFGTGYRALGKHYSDPKSLTSTPLSLIQDSLEAYNKVLGYQYLNVRHPEVRHYYSGGGRGFADMAQLVRRHTSGMSENVWLSPFVSTTNMEYKAKDWATSRGTSEGLCGLLMEARLPAAGIVVTTDRLSEADDGITDPQLLRPGFLKTTDFLHPIENELLVPGAITPASIQKIKTYQNRFGGDRITLEAERVIEDGTGYVDISDHQTGEIRRHMFDTATGCYVYVSTKPLPDWQPTEEVKSLEPHLSLSLHTVEIGVGDKYHESFSMGDIKMPSPSIGHEIYKHANFEVEMPKVLPSKLLKELIAQSIAYTPPETTQPYTLNTPIVQNHEPFPLHTKPTSINPLLNSLMPGIYNNKESSGMTHIPIPADFKITHGVPKLGSKTEDETTQIMSYLQYFKKHQENLNNDNDDGVPGKA